MCCLGNRAGYESNVKHLHFYARDCTHFCFPFSIAESDQPTAFSIKNVDKNVFHKPTCRPHFVVHRILYAFHNFWEFARPVSVISLQHEQHGGVGYRNSDVICSNLFNSQWIQHTFLFSAFNFDVQCRKVSKRLLSISI